MRAALAGPVTVQATELTKQALGADMTPEDQEETQPLLGPPGGR